MVVTVNALRCPKCNDVIFSRHHHDMRWCSCESIAIDGGLFYTKVSIAPGIDHKSVSPVQLIIPGVTPSDLYQDWNKSIDKYGRIYYYDLENSKDYQIKV